MAQQPAHEQAQPVATPPAASAQGPGTPAGGMGVAGLSTIMTIRMMMGGMATMARYVEGRLAFLKAELKITDAQLALWNAVADATRANAGNVGDVSEAAMRRLQAAPLPEKLESLEKMMAAQLEAIRRVQAAVAPLYAALSDDQKKTADELLMGQMGVL